MRVERREERRLNGPRICHAFESTSANVALQDRRAEERAGRAAHVISSLCADVFIEKSARDPHVFGTRMVLAPDSPERSRCERILGRGDARPVCGPRKSIGDRWGVSLYVGGFADQPGIYRSVVLLIARSSIPKHFGV